MQAALMTSSSSVVDSVSTVDLKADRLAQSDYPRNRHPGWSRGSVAYHAVDAGVLSGAVDDASLLMTDETGRSQRLTVASPQV
ncbi:hypothetical protein INR49_031877 [Caranx melampygus]|nr:hypothetical protein INR49_031877 [Caranx melampygus]